jgi:hypothetical protein
MRAAEPAAVARVAVLVAGQQVRRVEPFVVDARREQAPLANAALVVDEPGIGGVGVQIRDRWRSWSVEALRQRDVLPVPATRAPTLFRPHGHEMGTRRRNGRKVPGEESPKFDFRVGSRE